MPIVPEHYQKMDWLPCPECWDEEEYISEQWVILDSYGAIQLNDDDTPFIDPDWAPDLDYPMHGDGVTVKLDVDGGRTFRGCVQCGGLGKCYKPTGDSIFGKSWHQWVIVDGGITPGSGKIPKVEATHART